MGYKLMSLLLYVPLLLKGAFATITAWVVSMVISLSIGMCVGIISCRQLTSIPLSTAVRTYTFIAKGIPAYVQILIAYFVIPALLGINISGFLAATAALGFCSSGYITEIVRSGMNTISPGQWDACFVLGYSIKDTLIRVILPQALKNIVSPLFGEFEQLLKSTSLLATVGFTELTRTGMNIISRELNPISIYITIACIYLLFSFVLQLIVYYTEKKISYGYR
jgi:His/Glu/Gln/Arg/opine family amino acid ABC transporter permease subunit